MEVAHLMSRIREELNESGRGVFFTDADINDSLEDGYVLFCLFTGLLEGQTRLTIEANKVYYDLSYVSDYVRPIAVYDPNTKRFLKPIDSVSLNKNIINWEMSAGNPMFFCYFPTQLIAFFPHYYTVPQVNYFEVFYKAWPVDFDSKAIIELPHFAEDCLVNYCVSDLYDQLLETEKSAIAWKKFVDDLQMCKHKINRPNAGEYLYMEKIK